jgi:DNA-binding FadR family transcriptional regulator
MLSASVDADLLTQLSEVRLLVEPSAVELAATRATTVDLAAIEAAYVAMTAGVDSKTETVGPNFVEADTAFHQAILRACHNELLEQLGRVIDAALRLSFSRTAQVPGAARGTLRLHGRIAEHLAKRDGPGAAKAMRALINQAIDDIAHLDHSVSYRRAEASRAAEAGGGRHTKGG